MDLSILHPKLDSTPPERGVQEILRSILVRTNLVPGIRHALGWRGLKDSSAGIEGWTAKVESLPGVFGIAFEQFKTEGEWQTGCFCMDYFPAPDEELVDNLSIQAGILTQQEEYISCVREFLAHPEFIEAFRIATVELSVNRDGSGLQLGLEGLTQQIITAEKGVSISRNGEWTELVTPGGIDQDFPSFQVAYSFFRILAASVSFNLGEPPTGLSDGSRRGYSYSYNSETGSFRQLVSETARERVLQLVYGDLDHFVHNGEEDWETWHHGRSIPDTYQDELWWSANSIGAYRIENRETSGVDNRPQLVVVSGFLGSGKTSFLQNFIEYQSRANRFTAVIQNEIGEVGLDGKLLDQDFAVTEMDEGCVCCTLVGNLRTAVNGILEKFRPDFIILETTGVANPFNLLDELAEMEEMVRFDTVTTLVDGLNIEETLEQYETAANQIQAADLLILNKIDLLSHDNQQSVRDKLRQMNPHAPIVTSSYGDISPGILFDSETKRRESRPHPNPETHNHTCHKHDHAGHDHSHHHHSHRIDGLSSLKIDFQNAVNKDQLVNVLSDVPEEVFRIKGVIDIDSYEVPMLVQFVGGRYEISQYPEPDSTERYLIVIGRDLADNFSESAFKASMMETGR